MKTTHRALIVMLAASLMVACGESSNKAETENVKNSGINIDENANNSGEKAEDMIRGFTEAVNQLGKKVDTVSASQMFELLPEAIPGMTRGDYSAKKGGIEGFSMSSATAMFEEDDGSGELELSVTDIGNVRGIAQFGLEMLDFEIDEVNQDGFQRTTEYKGYKSFQSSTKTRSGSTSEMIVFVGDRIVLKATGSNVDWELIEDVVDAIPVKKMEAMIK